MARGRCPGCGKTDPYAKKIKTHMVECAAVAELYKTGPVLAPEAEYERWQREDNSQAIRDERKQVRVVRVIGEIGEKVALQKERWRTKDLLDD